MKTAIRWGACLVIAATAAGPLADEGAGTADALGVERRTVWTERYPDVDVDAGAASGEPSPVVDRLPDRVVVPLAAASGGVVVQAGAGSAAPHDSGDERWLREREGYRDGGY